MNRIKGVDFVRTLAVFAVILIHTRPFASNDVVFGGEITPASTINLLSRFAVPFFFVVSGYFWGNRIGMSSGAWSASIPTLKRLLQLFVLWNLIYMIPLDLNLIAKDGLMLLLKIPYWQAMAFRADPLNWIFSGTGFHLWFLTSLMCCVAICALFNDMKRPRALMSLAVSMFIFATIAKAYAAAAFGIHTSFNTRNGPFFGLIFFVTGIFLSRASPKPEWFSYGVIAMAAGTTISFGEIQYLNSQFGTSTVQDFVFGTYLQGLGASLIALSDVRFVNHRGTAALGPLAFGIYAVHVVFIEIFKRFDIWPASPLGDITRALAVFTLSGLAAWLLSRFKTTRSLVI